MANTEGRRSTGNRRPVRLGAAVFPGGVLAVHELRYLLAYGAHAGRELGAHGDSYVGTASVAAGLLLTIPLAGFAGRLLGARRGRRSVDRPRLRPWQSWLVWSGLLIVGFCGLEAVEMVFEPEHADGLAGIFGSGGWWALPAAALVAAVLTLLRRGGRALVRRAARDPGCRRSPAAASIATARGSLARPIGRRTPLAGRAAGRAPPGRRARAVRPPS